MSQDAQRHALLNASAALPLVRSNWGLTHVRPFLFIQQSKSAFKPEGEPKLIYGATCPVMWGGADGSSPGS